MQSKRVSIHMEPPYDVVIGRGAISRCGALLREVTAPCRAAVITDETVGALYLPPVLESLRDAGYEPLPFVFPGGERAKSMATLADMLEFLAGVPFTRSDVVLALGGGIVGDVAGFAAAVYARGIRLVQLPTTLLAAVDSSVGGKTAVNLAAGKNLAGAFWQPSLVICDPDCLQSLPPDIRADGMAEVIKYGVLSDPELFAMLDAGAPEQSLPEIIARCVAVKGRLVEADTRDVGSRRLLNLGHTVGHAIEKLSGFSIRHGHAVAIGMVILARAAERLDLAARGTAADIARVCAQNGLPTRTDFSARALAAAAGADKKRAGAVISLVLPRRIGDCFLRDFPVAELEEVIALGLEGGI